MTRTSLVFLGLLAALVVPALQVFYAEKDLARGELILFELAPVDPRSLIQGDYMALRWTMEDDLSRERIPETDHMIVRIDADRVATFSRYDDATALAEDERRIDLVVREGEPDFAPNAWFFEEGQAERYEPARYGVLNVTPEGQVILTGMADANKNRLDQP